MADRFSTYYGQGHAGRKVTCRTDGPLCHGCPVSFPVLRFLDSSGKALLAFRILGESSGISLCTAALYCFSMVSRFGECAGTA